MISSLKCSGFYIVALLLIISCEKEELECDPLFDPNCGSPNPETSNLEANVDSSSVSISWESNEFALSFSYRLEPLSYTNPISAFLEWSEWSPDTSATLDLLDEGEYSFYVKSRFNLDNYENTAKMVSFTIDAVTGPSLRMYPLHQAVVPGSRCDIYLYVEEVENLAGMELYVSYNTAVVSQINITKEGLLANSSTFFTDLNYGDGIISIIDSPDFMGLNEPGAAVAKLTFTVTGSDTLSFLESSVFKDSVNHPINILKRVEGIIEVGE